MTQLMTYDTDSKMNWDVVKALGHDVQSFTDPGEALDYTRANPADIALLGGSEGIDLIRYLREISPQFKVVVFCDSPIIEEIRQALGSGSGFGHTRGLEGDPKFPQFGGTNPPGIQKPNTTEDMGGTPLFKYIKTRVEKL